MTSKHFNRYVKNIFVTSFIDVQLLRNEYLGQANICFKNFIIYVTEIESYHRDVQSK
jgi:hypothetical protein